MATTLTTGMVSTSQNPANRQVLDMADEHPTTISRDSSCFQKNLSAM